jgi:hypothetical protein
MSQDSLLLTIHPAQIRPLLDLLHDQAGGDVFLSKVRPGNHHGQLSLTLHMQPWCTQRLIGALMQHLQQAEIGRVGQILAA